MNGNSVIGFEETAFRELLPTTNYANKKEVSER
jgi:hypothetical protein